MAWRVVVDEVLCQGHAVCESEAPDVFEVPKHGKVTVLDATPPDAQRAAVQQAVTYCPTHAISIQED
jgi:sterol 14-demethylase